MSRADDIAEGAFKEAEERCKDKPELAYESAGLALALACALLTSPVKAERERGKAMVRFWKTTGMINHPLRTP